MVSIIIVNYKTERELYKCIESIQNSEQKVNYEIIVVDNDEDSKIEDRLKEKFKEVRYIKSPRNLGYGGGNNLGTLHSKGEFLFFLNPDTIVKKDAIGRLVGFLKTNEKAGIVAPIFLDSKETVYPSQGSEELTPLSAIFSLSFINRLLPNNPISKHYFLSSWDKKNPRKVGNVPGTAFLIRKNLFEQVGGFDENFFLYFEEFDLCKRVRKLGYDLFIVPSSQVVHHWGVSTNRSSLNIKKIFSESKFYYFKKHYGLFWAILVRSVTGFNNIHLLLILILILSLFLRFYKLQELMIFIGDQGWFYLFARDMLLTGTVPLVGIPSSHPWIHQGPLWTYMLAFSLWIGKFNPASGAYMVSLLGIVTVFLVYKVGSLLFGKGVGIISAALYASSPLVVVSSRMAYHTSPIPFFTLLFVWSIFQWVKGKSIYFPFSIFFLGVLYNFELATSVLWLIFGLVAGYGVWKRKSWAVKIFTKKTIAFSLIAFLAPMTPIIIYDLQHGFPQTFKFAAWIGYKILGFFGIINSGMSFGDKSYEMISFFSNQYIFLIFPANKFIAFIIFIFSTAFFVKIIYKSIIMKKNQVGNLILLLWLLIPVSAFFANKTPSDAYMPVIFPAVIIATALFFESLMHTKIPKILVITVIALILLINSNILLSNKFFSVPTFKDRLIAAKKIVDRTTGKNYDIVGEGQGSEFESFTMNYEYLTWWLGHGPAEYNPGQTVIISESKNGINVRVVNK